MNAPPKLLLENISAFKFWRIQKPNAAKLLKEIIWRWRGASAYVPGKSWRWVVYPRERWSEWTGLSRNQLDRALKELVDVGLIAREQHRFAGSEVRTFLRPTQMSIMHAGKPQDMSFLELAGKHTVEKSSEMPKEKSKGGSKDKLNEKSNEKTDYTPSLPLPSQSLKITSSYLASDQAIDESKQGKGMAGENPDVDYNEIEEENYNFEKAYIKSQAIKKQKVDKTFPEKKGAHEKFVKHPSKMNKNWYSFSLKLQVKLYAKYLDFVQNWYNSKNASSGNKIFPYTPISDDEWTEEDDAALIASYEKNKAKKTPS